jgi:hypothetical protein
MPSYKNEQTVRQVQEGVIFEPGVTKSVNKILIESVLVVSGDLGLEVGDVLTGAVSAVTGRVLRKYGAHIDIVDLTLAGEYTNFEVGEQVNGSISGDHAHVVSVTRKLTKTVATPLYNPAIPYATHTLTSEGAEDEVAYLDVDRCAAIKISGLTANSATVYLEAKTNLPALVSTLASGSDPVIQALDGTVSKVIVSFTGVATLTIDEFDTLAGAGVVTHGIPSTESVGSRAESLAKKAESQGLLDNSLADHAESEGKRGLSTARRAESQGTLDNSIADRAQSLARTAVEVLGVSEANSLALRAQSVGRKAESQGLLDNSIADEGESEAKRGLSTARRAESLGKRAESQGTLDNSLADVAGSLARVAESQGALDNSIADHAESEGKRSLSTARLAASKAVLALSLARV